MKRLSWKYMAGLIDGEGCVDMQAGMNKKYDRLYCRPRLRVTLSGESGKQLLQTCQSNFGGHLEERSTGNPNWQDSVTWGPFGSSPLRSFLQNIVNHLILKKEQAKFAIWWIDKIGGKHVAEEVRRLGIDELKAMKRDPQRLSERAIQHLESMRQSGQLEFSW